MINESTESLASINKHAKEEVNFDNVERMTEEIASMRLKVESNAEEVMHLKSPVKPDLSPLLHDYAEVDDRIELPPAHITATSGYLHNMTPEEEVKLFQLWNMLINAFKLPFHEDDGSKKKKGFNANELLEKVKRDYSQASTDGAEAVWALSEDEVQEMEANPLFHEFCFMAGQDDADRILLRYLRARKWSLTDAFVMLIDCLQWRHTYGVQDVLRRGDHAIKHSLMAVGKNYVWKTDKEGRLCMFVRLRYHLKSAQTLQETDIFTTYSMEMMRMLRDHDDQLAIVIFDLQDTGLANLDTGALQLQVAAAQSYYPEHLGKCLIKDAPWVFSGLWKLIRPILDPVVASKVDFVKDEDLFKYFDKETLPLEYGGSDPFVFSFNSPTESDWPPALSDEEEEAFHKKKKALRFALAQLTREVSFSLALGKGIAPEIKSRRQRVKNQLKKCYHDYMHRTIPKNNYHRMGVMEADGTVNWKGYAQKHLQETSKDRKPGLQLS